MPIVINDYVSVSQKIADLGCHFPEGLTVLPINFESALSKEDFRQVSEAATVKTILRNAGLPYEDIVEKGQRPLYVQNNAFEWVAPSIFVSAALWSENQNYISIALSLIANYVTDFFKGMSGKKTVKLDIVVEKAGMRTCKKISYEGDADGLRSLQGVIREISDD